MSCRNYETILTEMARGQMLDAHAKQDALAHVETCARCAARFSDEQTLTAGLRAVAAGVAQAQTPVCIEAALLTAFRQRSPFVPAVAPVRASASRWKRWSIAAAAAILIVSTFAVLRLLSANPTETAKEGAHIAQPVPHSSSDWLRDKTGDDENGIQPTPVVNTPDHRLAPAPQFRRGRTNGRRELIHDAGLNSGRIPDVGNSENAANADEEIATDFLPLTYGGSFSQIDDGQVVRVELPRSALHSLGLPVNAERGGERVKADVLLGHDGVARAIRLVR